MSEIIYWKAFKLGDIFERSTKLALRKNQKDLDLSTTVDLNHFVSLVSASRDGSGSVGYLNISDYDENLVSINKITFDDQWGYTFFQKEPFIITGGHNAILEVKNDSLKQLLDLNLSCYSFLSLVINQITIKSTLYGYGYKINNKFDREIILLPVIEVSTSDQWIWSEEDKYYTLAVSFIQSMMDEAKKRREEKTIKFYESERLKYESERLKYESERLKYESDYLKEQCSLIWKSFKLGDLFLESTEHYLEKSKKNYEISDTKDENFSVAVCAASKNNNGIVGYIQEIDDVPVKKRKGFLTKGGFGHVFYQADWFIKPGGSWGMLNILKIKNDALKLVLDQDILRYHFFARILTKIFTGMASWGYAVPLDREIILLPLIEVSRSENWIWNEGNKYFSLAVSTLSYLYLEGQINIQQRKIEEYSYKY